MPIATTAAIIGGSALLGAGASVLAANKNKKAINQSTDAQLQANRESIASQERLAQQNIGLSRDLYNNTGQLNTDIYNQKQQTLQPWAAGGFNAFNQINGMLGLPQQQGYTPTPLAFTPLSSGTPAPTPAATTPVGQAPAIPQTYAAQQRNILEGLR